MLLNLLRADYRLSVAVDGEGALIAVAGSAGRDHLRFSSFRFRRRASLLLSVEQTVRDVVLEDLLT